MSSGNADPAQHEIDAARSAAARADKVLRAGGVALAVFFVSLVVQLPKSSDDYRDAQRRIRVAEAAGENHQRAQLRYERARHGGSSDKELQELAKAAKAAEEAAKAAKVDLEKLRRKEISLEFFGVAGIDLGIKRAEVSALYIPVLWTVGLLAFLLYFVSARREVLNLYCRALRRLSPPLATPEVADRIGGAPRCPWWWLAPLPDRARPGGSLAPGELRHALGWEHFHRRACARSIVAGVALAGLQLGTFAISLAVSPVFGGDTEAFVIPMLIAAVAASNLALLAGWLGPSPLPDEGINEPEHAPGFSRQQFLLLLGAVVAGFSLHRLGPRSNLERAMQRGLSSSPRFRRRKRPFAPTTLAVGLYENPRSGVIHLVDDARPMRIIRASSSIKQARLAPVRESDLVGPTGDAMPRINHQVAPYALERETFRLLGEDRSGARALALLERAIFDPRHPPVGPRTFHLYVALLAKHLPDAEAGRRIEKLIEHLDREDSVNYVVLMHLFPRWRGANWRERTRKRTKWAGLPM